MKFQWSIQSSHIQLVRSQVTYLTCRNEHIWPLTMCLQMIESFLFGFHSSYFWSNTTQILEKQWHELFYVFLTNKPLVLVLYILIQIAPPFPSQTSFRSKAFFSSFSFWRLTFEELFWELKKKKKKTIDQSRSSKSIDQSFMTSLKIYLQ